MNSLLLSITRIISINTITRIISINTGASSESLAVCVNSSLKITCTTTTSFLVWTFIPNQESPSKLDFKVYTSTSIPADDDTIGEFSLRLESTHPLLVSTATLDDVDTKHNGSVLTCANTDALVPETDQIANIAITVNGKSTCVVCYY